MIYIEQTDTFGGEANYSWVRRWTCKAEMTERLVVRLAKKLAGYTGKKCRVDTCGDEMTIKPRGICEVVFVSDVSEDCGINAIEVDSKGEPIVA